MSYRKYLKDYSIEEYIDKKGKVKTTAVYTGGDYIISPAISVGDKRLIMLASVLSWLALVGALIPNTGASRLWYVVMPFVFSALPLFLLTGVAASLAFERDVLTREKAEKIANRMPPCSIIAAVLSAAAFLGLVITATLSNDNMLIGDILFGALSLILAAAASVIFIKCRTIKACKIDNENQ